MFNRLKSAVKQVAVSLALATTLGIASTPASAEVYTYAFVDTQASKLAGLIKYDTVLDKFFAESLTAFFTDGETFIFDGELTIEYADSARLEQQLDDLVEGGVTYTQQLSFELATSDPYNEMKSNVGSGEILYRARWIAGYRNGRGVDVLFSRHNAPHDATDGAAFGSFAFGQFTNVSSVPEPSTYAMMAVGLFGIAGMRRRQNKA
jgi:hypothetical protein